MHRNMIVELIELKKTWTLSLIGKHQISFTLYMEITV